MKNVFNGSEIDSMTTGDETHLSSNACEEDSWGEHDLLKHTGKSLEEVEKITAGMIDSFVGMPMIACPMKGDASASSPMEKSHLSDDEFEAFCGMFGMNKANAKEASEVIKMSEQKDKKRIEETRSKSESDYIAKERKKLLDEKERILEEREKLIQERLKLLEESNNNAKDVEFN